MTVDRDDRALDILFLLAFQNSPSDIAKQGSFYVTVP
jgi:hypothetical protein